MKNFSQIALKICLLVAVCFTAEIAFEAVTPVGQYAEAKRKKKKKIQGYKNRCAPGKIGECPASDGSKFFVRKFTNYAPSLGGINGHCGTSASGKDACDYALEDFIEGRARSAFGAVSQYGGTADLFGGSYRAEPLEPAVGGKVVYVMAGDRYSTTSNCQCKMDIVTNKARSPLTSRVNLARGYLVPAGRLSNLLPSRRKIERDPDAETPVVPSARCKVVKTCKYQGGAVQTGRACNSYSARWICFEKDQSCAPSSPSCADSIH